MKVNPINFGYAPAFKADVRTNRLPLVSFPKEHADIISSVLDEIETTYEDLGSDNILITVTPDVISSNKRPLYGFSYTESFKDIERARKEIIVNNDRDFPNDGDEDVEMLRKSDPEIMKRLRLIPTVGTLPFHISLWPDSARKSIDSNMRASIQGMTYSVPKAETKRPTEYVERVGWNV